VRAYPSSTVKFYPKGRKKKQAPIEMVTRYKYAAESGKWTYESQTYDGTVPGQATKRHIVEEQEEDGSWRVHDHEDVV
jgi:hypothetical protein